MFQAKDSSPPSELPTAEAVELIHINSDIQEKDENEIKIE